jgi:DNA-binding transcriptional ArsR family regulator
MTTDQLDKIFAALADPTRRAILLRLTLGEATVNELAEPFDISLPAVSKHLKVLERAGLITRGKEAQYRPCRLETEQLKFAFDWLERYRQHWEESIDRLDDFLQEAQRTPHDQPTPQAAVSNSQDGNDSLPEPQPIPGAPSES